ncbi:MAG: hypothetical protein AMS22_16960 [Thiotrichales bacterium SG8_50]|nr:MAG: hypothetical protein AMS22_16960 [Thiotrichales bacterium SG8_50]
MKKPSKAALLSGLIFPGIGHIFLREYFRGSILLVVSLASLSVVVTSAYQRALLVVDRIVSGDVAMEAGAIAQAVSNPIYATDKVLENVAIVLLAACWLAGIIDSYRLGVLQEKSDM